MAPIGKLQASITMVNFAVIRNNLRQLRIRSGGDELRRV